MLTFKWQRHTSQQFLKGSGRLVEGPVGSSVLIQNVQENIVPGGMSAAAARVSGMMQQYARQNARWQDQSGDARRSLVGDPVINPPEYAAVLRGGGGLDYFIHLMRMKNGMYDIVSETQQVFSSRVGGAFADEIRLALEGRGSQFRAVATGRFT